MTTVAVIMSTYNGEKFLREQLDSILAQRNVEVTLFVRDDGSKDGTQAILSEYAEKYGNIRISFEENVGVGNSFMNALYATPDTFDFYAFADQDDIWLEDKLAEAAKMLRESGKYLYASNQECMDKYGDSQGIRFHGDIYIKPADILGFNMLAGCTIVISNEFYKLIVNEKNRPAPELLKLRIHDVWVVMVASIYDSIIYDDRAFIKYRLHENNTSGGIKASWKRTFKERLRTVTHKERQNKRSKLAKEVLSIFPGPAGNYPEVIHFANIKTHRAKKWIIKHKTMFIAGTGESKIAFTLKVLSGLL